MEAGSTELSTRALGVPLSAGDASLLLHTFVSRKSLKASACSTLSKSSST